MTADASFAGVNRSLAEAAAGLESQLRRRGAVPILIVVLWACAVFPNLSLRSFILEEGTNAEIARDILARGDFLQPDILRDTLARKTFAPGLAGCGVRTIHRRRERVGRRGRRPCSPVLGTALTVQAVTRRYTSLNASLFAALAFVFCPLLLQKLTVAEPDTLITALSFAAFVVWGSGIAAGRRPFCTGSARACCWPL